MAKFKVLFIFLLYTLSVLGNVADSTLEKMESANSTDNKIRILLKDAWIVHKTNPAGALNHVKLGEKDSALIQSAQLIDSLYKLKAYCYGDMNKRSESLAAHLTRLRVLSRYPENTRSHYAANFETAGVLINQGNGDLAKPYYYKCYEIAKKLENKIPLGEIMIRISKYHVENNKIDSAIWMLNESKKIFNEIKRLNFVIGTIDMDIARIYKKQGKPKLALSKTTEALNWADTTQNIDFAILLYSNAAKIYLDYKKNDLAIDILLLAESLSERNNKLYYLPTIYRRLAIAYENNNIKESHKYLSKLITINDSVITKQNNDKIAELKFQYEDEMQKLEISNLEKDKKLAKIENNKKGEQIKIIGIALFFLSILLVVLVIMIKKVRTNNKLLHQKKIEVEERNKEIEDSINYAQRIQEAMIPHKERLSSLFPESFVIYYPKDKLSGDFYWIYNVTTTSKNHLNLFALGDCTGHGVPGALLSILGINYLNLGAVSSIINSPGEALNYLDKGIRDTFNHSNELIRDGMDIVIGAIEIETHKLYYSCAKNPIYIIRENEIITLKGDKKAIGNDDKGDHFSFSDFTFDLKKGDMIYCLSDGLQDQFGGERGKKYKVGNLKKLLLKTSLLPASDQRDALTKEFNSWKGDLEQIDDVTILGIRY